uniref:cytochrome b n=1 Tax=Charcotia amundseni TaxID=2259499 RepID=UPI001FF4DA12|nr:cytochrome b [Charcotia amundseni]UIN24689.1 cytochrome b [Charcotia amundseni]
MTNQYFKKSIFFKVFHSTLVSLPAPSNLSLMWNMGSLLFMCLVIQLITGLLLASTYIASMEVSFNLISFFMENADKGWFIRYVHANGASLFFFCLYLHTGRGMYYSSYIYTHTWNIGVTIFLLTMAAAFLGYVLPVNQMSYWGASVITNLFSEIPYIGGYVVQLIWGGPTVNDPTIMRFFTFHFIIPFVILMMVLIHITLLHTTGSMNPLGVNVSLDKMVFHVYFSIKDFMGVLFIMTLFFFLCLYCPLILGDDENFTVANSLVTPHHIQPEWYFLFAYAILRSIPNKLGGVIALLFSILILYFMPYMFLGKMKSSMFYPLNKVYFWSLVVVVCLLTWIGMRPVEEPYILTGQVLTFMYFIYYVTNPLLMKVWDGLLEA